MNKAEARIVLLEDALIQAQHTVGFMHGCLTDPKGYGYEYPMQTLDRLVTWGELVPLPETCVHSMEAEGCVACEGRVKRLLLRSEAEAVLSLSKE